MTVVKFTLLCLDLQCLPIFYTEVQIADSCHNYTIVVQ